MRVVTPEEPPQEMTEEEAVQLAKEIAPKLIADVESAFRPVYEGDDKT
jgi:hypothetical protein